jgi:hypothetical protein
MCIPKCILDSFGIRRDTRKIHAKYQDTCILLECKRACKILLRYIRIHSGYVYLTCILEDTCRTHAGYMQDTSRYVSNRKLSPKRIGNPPDPGFVRYSREFVDGPDPFQTGPHGGVGRHQLRRRRPGLLPDGPTGTLWTSRGPDDDVRNLHVPHKAVRRAVGDHLIRHDKMDPEERLAHAKKLLNSLDKGGLLVFNVQFSSVQLN